MTEIVSPKTVYLNDICSHIYLPLVCETGEYDTTRDILQFCDVSSSALNTTTDPGTEQTPANLPSSSGRTKVIREAIPSVTGYTLQETTCGGFSPEFMAMIGAQAPLIDSDGSFRGWEPPSQEVASCASCGIEAGGCQHDFAKITIMNGWCGRVRDSEWPYAALVTTSMRLAVQDSTINHAQGFTAFQQFTFNLNSNPAFTDPWGLMALADGTPAPTNEPYQYIMFNPGADSELRRLIDATCFCPSCTRQETTDIGGTAGVPDLQQNSQTVELAGV